MSENIDDKVDMKTIWAVVTDKQHEDLVKANFNEFPDSMWEKKYPGASPDNIWFRPIPHRVFAIKLAKNMARTNPQMHVVEFDLKSSFIDQFTAYPIDGAGHSAFTYFVSPQDKEELNANLASNIKVIRSYN